MHLIETTVEQRSLLPLPAAAIVIDMRGVSDDEVVEWLRIEVADLANEMKAQNVYHWRHLTEFLSFMRLAPLQEEAVQPKSQHTKGAQQGLIGHIHHYHQEDSPFFQEDNTHADNAPFTLLEENMDGLVQEIDRIRTNRVAAVADLNKAGIPGHSRRDDTVRVIFLTDVARPESLSGAALHAERLKAYYRKLMRPGYQPLINTTVLCLGNRGEAGPPTKLIQGLLRNNSWDHLDSLILSEDYREDAASIAGSVQAYLAELLLYVLLIIPPLAVDSPDADTGGFAQQNGQAAQQGQTIGLPPQTYVVGLAALEYSARWGRRWLNFGLAKEIVNLLRQKPADANIEKLRIADTADDWLKDWHNRVQTAVPNDVSDEVPALQGIYRARRAADTGRRIFLAKGMSVNIGERTLRDLEEYLGRLAETYVTSASEPTLQNALLQSAPQIMLAQQGRQNKTSAERKVTVLGKLQVEAEQVLGLPKFFTGANGSVPRARAQLSALGSAIARFLKDHQNNPLHPLSMKESMQSRRNNLEQTGSKKIDHLRKHIESWPFLSSLLFLKQSFSFLTLMFIMFLSMVTILLGSSWLHYLIGQNAPGFLSLVDTPFLGLPLLEILTWIIVLLFWGIEVITLTPRLVNKHRAALKAEATFEIALIVFAAYGFFVDFSLSHLDKPAGIPAGPAYLALLAHVPEWSLIGGVFAALLLIIEAVYFLWWLDGLHRKRSRIVKELNALHQGNIRDVCQFVADEVALDMLQRAELTDGKGGLGNYYFRVERLCTLLDEVAVVVQGQQQLSANRLLLSQSDTQHGAGVPSSRNIWLNLHIREEKLAIDTLTDAYKGLVQQLATEHEELRELAEFLIRTEGIEKPVEIGQQFEENLAKINNEQRQLLLLITTLVGVAMRFAVEPLSARSVDPIIEHYQNMTETARLDLPNLNTLIRMLNKGATHTTLQSLTTADNRPRIPTTLQSNVVADAIALWGQLFWRNKDRKLAQLLVQDNVLAQLASQGDYDPRAVMRRLMANTSLFARSLRAGDKAEVFLLLSPSPESYQFRQGLRNVKIPRTIDFPDVERILLLGVQRYVAEPILQLDAGATVKSEMKEEPTSGQGGSSNNNSDPAATSQLIKKDQSGADQPTATSQGTDGSYPVQHVIGSQASGDH